MNIVALTDWMVTKNYGGWRMVGLPNIQIYLKYIKALK